jgi:hypothetical protein
LDQNKPGARDETCHHQLVTKKISKCQSIHNEMKNKNHHIIGTILKLNRIITETGKIDTANIHIHKIYEHKTPSW